jgi:hypothetical protein
VNGSKWSALPYRGRIPRFPWNGLHRRPEDDSGVEESPSPCPYGISNPGRPSPSQLFYRLTYPGRNFQQVQQTHRPIAPPLLFCSLLETTMKSLRGRHKFANRRLIGVAPVAVRVILPVNHGICASVLPGGNDNCFPAGSPVRLR